MTPAVGWREADYYAASRAARAAFDRTDQQLSILSDSPALALMGGLDEADAGRRVRLVEPAQPATPPWCMPQGKAGSTPTERADR